LTVQITFHRVFSFEYEIESSEIRCVRVQGEFDLVIELKS